MATAMFAQAAHSTASRGQWISIRAERYPKIRCAHQPAGTT